MSENCAAYWEYRDKTLRKMLHTEQARTKGYGHLTRGEMGEKMGRKKVREGFLLKLVLEPSLKR